MSRQVRYRVGALALGALFLGAPLLFNGTARAEQVEGGGGQQVVFAGGGMLGLACRSQPEVESLTLPAAGLLKVINHTGHEAELLLGGLTKGIVAEDGMAEVVFHHGTTAVMLSPNCALADDSRPLMVTAQPDDDPVAMPDPIPVPSDHDDDPDDPDESASPTRDTAGTALPDTVAPATTPQRPSTTKTNRPGYQGPARPSTVAALAATSAVAMPQGGSGSRVKDRVVHGTRGASPAFSGMPPGEDRTLVSGVPSLASVSEAVSAGAPAVVMPTSTEVMTAEPLVAARPLSRPRPIGLLVLTACVCVMGVAAGAIRAIVSERASRAPIA